MMSASSDDGLPLVITTDGLDRFSKFLPREFAMEDEGEILGFRLRTGTGVSAEDFRVRWENENHSFFL